MASMRTLAFAICSAKRSFVVWVMGKVVRRGFCSTSARECGLKNGEEGEGGGGWGGGEPGFRANFRLR